MRHVVIDQQDSFLSVERARLVIRHAEWPKPQSVPLAQLESVVIQSRTQLDSAVLSQLAAHDVRLQIVPARGQGEACYLVGTQHKDARRRLAQYAVSQDEAAQLAWAKRVVRLRLRSQRLLLLQAAQIRHDLAAMLYQQARQIGEIAARAVHQPTVEAVRGSEGAATALYFQAYQRLFAPSLGFNNRNRRPPQDPVNVLLSLSYTMLHSTVAKAVQTVGLDPQLGALHEVAYGRDSLVCDLVELQRAQVEWWVWRLCATETIRVEDFTLSDAVGHMPCSFGKAGRGRFYQAFALVQDPWLRDAKQAAWVLVKRLSPQTAILTPVSDEE